MFKNQPKGLFALAFANTGERFGYYTMLAIFTLFMQAKFGWDESTAGHVNAIFLAVVYFAPLLGGFVADRIGYGKCVVIGMAVMFIGYLGLAIPTAATTTGMLIMFAGLLGVSLGTGLFKGNLQVLVGNLYDDPKYADKRDSAFSLFYMAINIGSMFAPSMARWITNMYLDRFGFVYDAANNSPEYLQALYGGYGLCFGVACVSLILSAIIYFACRKWFKHADIIARSNAQSQQENVLTPKQEKDRIMALLLVFAVVVFFWMTFHQNGSALTFFAKKYTNLSVSGPMRIGFNIFSLALIAASVYTAFATFQSKLKKSRIICGITTFALWGGAILCYLFMDPTFAAQPSDFQQFNPFFVVALTPISMAFFAALEKRGTIVSAPTRIAWGMLVAGLGFAVITLASFGLTSPMDLGEEQTQSVLSPSWLISTYFTLTIAELLLSPMGISFVSKVAPPKYKGLMMGGWFGATAVGNYLSRIPSMLWNKIPLMYNWAILITLCVISAVVMFALLKKLNEMTK